MRPHVFRALRFESGADLVEFGAAPTGNRTGLTIETWVRPVALGDGNRPFVWQRTPAEQAGAGGPYRWALYATYDARLYLVAWDASGLVNVAYSRPGALRTGLWQHVAGVYDAVYGRISLWVDGREVTEDGDAPREATQGGPGAVQLGGYMQDPELGFGGEIGWGRISSAARYSVRFYPYIYAPEPVDPATVLQWSLAEGEGTIVDNAQGDATLDGAVTGATWTIWPPVGVKRLRVWPRPQAALDLVERATTLEIGRRM